MDKIEGIARDDSNDGGKYDCDVFEATTEQKNVGTKKKRTESSFLLCTCVSKLCDVALQMACCIFDWPVDQFETDGMRF